ncbi:ATP-binding protein [Sphingomonas sp. RT2P30]|uniref:PAS domain-containing sensor histidine kinase n=1 Tax=Parasphingomonas halimpatiens TaxID=3096162 RepID=UPI002FC8DA52
MVEPVQTSQAQETAKVEVEGFREALGPFVVAAEKTRMPTLFTDARGSGHAIIFANDSFLRLTGYERNVLLARDFDFLLADPLDHPDPADPTIRASIEAEFEDSAGEILEIECCRRDGRRFLAAVSINPVNDDLGNVVQHCLSFVDLTRHVARLRKERDQLHALYQHAPGFIATTEGPDHRLTFANTSFRTLMGNRALLGKTMAEAVPEATGQGIIRILDHVFGTGEAFVGSAAPLDLKGGAGEGEARRFLDFIYQPTRNAENEITGLFCEGHDVTAHMVAIEQVKLLQTQLIHLARVNAMGTMAATLSHELSQPLTIISNYVEISRQLVDAGGKSGGTLDDCLGKIAAAAARARDLIVRIRTMAKQGEPVREPFDLKKAVAEAVDFVRIGKPVGISIRDHVRIGMWAEGDRVQLQQVIINLVRNACDAFDPPDRGLVTLSSTVEGDRIIISVEDNGPGVPVTEIETLFEWTSSAKAEGMGLGLSISRTIVEAHDGKIWLDHNDADGARFSFSIKNVESPAFLLRA